MIELADLFKTKRKYYLSLISRALKHERGHSEDVLQEAMCRAIIKYDKYDPNRGPIHKWFNRILFNELYRFLRKERKHAHEDIEKYWWIEEALSKPLESVKLNVQDYTAGMSERDKKIIFLIYTLQYPIEDVAEMFNINNNNIWQICHRFRIKVRKQDAREDSI